MTFDNAPWALDGARTAARLARTASYIESGGVEGVIGQADLKVTALDVAGVGLQVAPGAGILLNRYQTSPNQSYAVSNTGIQLVDAINMPPAVPAAQSHLVCVTIGDPEFSSAGHPWMPSTPIPDDQRETYQYVRIFIVRNVPPGTTTFAQLGLHYPAYALARLDVPANTTTITNGLITDLRKLAKPRTSEEIRNIPSVGVNSLDTVQPTWEMFGGGHDVFIPEWATNVKLQAFLQGVNNTKDGSGRFGIAMFNVGYVPATPINEPVPRTSPSDPGDRKTYIAAGDIPVPANFRGTTVRFELVGSTNGAGSNGFISTDGASSSILRLRFEENVL